MNTTLKHSDALDAYAGMLAAYSDWRVRLATTLAVCAVLGVCAALLALASYWTLEHHAATAAGATATRYTVASAEAHSGMHPTAVTAQQSLIEPLYH